MSPSQGKPHSASVSSSGCRWHVAVGCSGSTSYCRRFCAMPRSQRGHPKRSVEINTKVSIDHTSAGERHIRADSDRRDKKVCRSSSSVDVRPVVDDGDDDAVPLVVDAVDDAEVASARTVES